MSTGAGDAAQCHVQTFAPVPWQPPDVAGAQPSAVPGAAPRSDGGPDAAGGVGAGAASAGPLGHGRERKGQQEGLSGSDGAGFYEHASLHASLETSGKMVLSLYSLGVGQSGQGVVVRGNREGRVTYAGGPSLAVAPHTIAVHRLRVLNKTLTLDPRVSKTADEMRAKAEVVRHRHFWGHQEIVLDRGCAVGGECDARAPAAGAAVPVVFLDRDGVINTLASYNTGPAAMQLLPGAGAAIARLQLAGCKVAVVSSQACVGKGYVRVADVHAVMDRMCRLLRRDAAAVVRPNGGGRVPRAGEVGSCVCVCVCVCMYGCMDGWMDGWMDVYI